LSPPDGEGRSRSAAMQNEVAIIGMACLFPGAPDLETYWGNILSKSDAITDPPADTWDPKIYYDPASDANDRTYCKRGGYIGDLAQFQPLDFGVMPANVDGGEPDQWLALRVARAALADAGYLESPKEHARTEVILGKGTYINRGNMTVGYHGLIVEQMLQVLKNLHPEYTDADVQAIKQELKAGLPPFSADTAPALIGNIIAGRIANRLDLMGPAYTVDAACASALLAVETGMRDLLSHKCDLALVGGVNVNTPLPTFILFCQLGALSRREQIRPFDKDADGTILGEGLGMVVLKRLDDAERDNDRIYAIIKGVGSASDGRALHVMAPRVEGEEMALRRAYEMAGVSPCSVGLIEAHGTATPVGDAVEIQALTRVFGERNGSLPSCAVGSVKSMIGHTMPAAGVAGLIKTALALYHKVLPPTLHCDEPHPALGLEKTPFYINSETRPWIHGSPTPRRAGVNAFGFGGINGHVVLEEYPDNEEAWHSRLLHWETEVCVLEGTSRQDLVEKAERLQGYLNRIGPIQLKDLAYTLNDQLQDKTYRLAIVASSVEDLKQKLTHAQKRLADPQCRQIKDNKGIFFFEESLRRQGKLAFLFPGEGAQYENMLLDLCLHFPEVRACFDLADRAFIDHPRDYLPSDYIFPRSVVSEPERHLAEKLLWRIDGAVEAVLIANWAMWSLMNRLEIRPDAILGHSTGDYSAMFASGIIAVDDELGYIKTIRAWNSTHDRLAIKHPVPEAALVAVATDAATVRSVIDQVGGDLYLAMENCPHQNVIVGHRAAAEQAVKHFRDRGEIYEFLPFDRPYHTPMFEPYAVGAGREFFSQLPLSAPNIDVYSCTTVSRYPTSLAAIQELFVQHFVRPVLFRQTIERMYADGVRIFVEVGPRGNLTAFVDDILRGLPHLAMPANIARRSGNTQLNHLVGVLAAQGIPMNLRHLYARRDPQRLPCEAAETKSTAWRGTAPRKLFLGMPHLHVTPRHQEFAPPKLQPGSSSASKAIGEHQAIQPSIAADTPKPQPSTVRDQAATGTALVMQEYAKGMESFLELQQLVMKAFLTNRQGQDNGHAAMALSANDFPLIGTVISQVPSQELVALRRLDQNEDTFLREHALGGLLSVTDSTLKPIMVVPLTMSMEMMAQAGSALIPGKVLIGMRDIQAHQWIQVDEPVTLRISARRASGAPYEVEVQVHNLESEAADHKSVGATPVIRGVMIFGDAYPTSPLIAPFSLAAERTSRLASANLYDGRLIFHGPCFQGVAAVERSGQDGLIGKLQVLSPEGLFRSTSIPRFITDPVILDSAGQLVAFWAAEYLERGFVVFPYQLKSLKLYGPNHAVGERVSCRLKLELLGTDRIRSNLDVLGPDGKVWMQLIGWEDRRFDLPQRFHRFWVSPREELMSLPWQASLDLLSGKDSFECRRLEALIEHGNAFWQDLWASLVLTRRERRAFHNLKGSASRKQEWLTGRTAAKDAVRTFLKRHYQLDLFPADIDIAQDEFGRPIPEGAWTQRLPAAPQLSLTHSNGMAVAIVGHEDSGSYLGIDIEAIRELPSSFESVAFAGEEERLLAVIPESARIEWILRLWCAKEAVAKALGRGLMDGPRSVQIQTFDLRTGMVTVALQGKLAETFADFVDSSLLVYTAREEDYVMASTLCERKAS
jgi:acyl transferase domain-containing protein/phosphopantetheinyl transferase